MRSDPEVQQITSQYTLGLPKLSSTGRGGELLGKDTGSSLEFQEYREYVPGDDIRHLDWSAFGRTDSLMVRQYREEFSPNLEILIDLSRSMTTGVGEKAEVALKLAAVIGRLAAELGAGPRVFLLGDDQPVRVGSVSLLDELTPESFNAERSLADLSREQTLPLRKGAVRLILSDFLFPHDPETLIRTLGREASASWCYQLLTSWEAEPSAVGGRRLVDAETELESDLVIDSQMVEDYRRRLHRLQTGLSQACRRQRMVFSPCIATEGLTQLARHTFTETGILQPA